MTTDNRTNEPTDGALLSALVAWSRAEHEHAGIKRKFEPADSLDDYNNSWIRRMRAALVAAQGAAPPVNSFGTSAEPVKNGAESSHVEPQAESDCWHEANCSCAAALGLTAGQEGEEE